VGPDRSRDEEEIAAIKLGLDLGMKLIDTAEMYGAGHSEELVGQAIQGRRDDVFVASKVSPSHFSYDSLLRAADNSLKRLGVKKMDLYQLHWPNARIPISETMRAMEKIVKDGLVRFIGVSNFSVEQMREAQKSLSREKIVSNQVEYSLIDRSPEARVLPFCRQENITLVAYSPLGQGRIPRGRGGAFKVLDKVADTLGRTRNEVALNWLLRDQSVVVIPKAVEKEHLQQNAQVPEWKLAPEDCALLGKAFS